MKNAVYADLTPIRQNNPWPVDAASRLGLPIHAVTRAQKAPCENPKGSTEEELTLWISIGLFLLLSLASGYLLWAKVGSAWPFSQ